MRFTRDAAILIALMVPFVAFAQQAKKPVPDSQTLDGTVIGADGNNYWSGFKVESGGKVYTFVTKYKAGQGTNPTVAGGKCCDIGTPIRVTYMGSLARNLLNVTRIEILDPSSTGRSLPPEVGVILSPKPGQTAVTPGPVSMTQPLANTSGGQSGTPLSPLEGKTILKPNQLMTFSLAPNEEKVFVLQMKKGDFADLQWLEAESAYDSFSFEIYDAARKELLEKRFALEESMWFVAPSDGDFLLVCKLENGSENSNSQRISLQYSNKFKLPLGMKLKETRRVNGYDVKIMTAPKASENDPGDSILLIEKNGQLQKALRNRGGSSGFSFMQNSAEIMREIRTTTDKANRTFLANQLKSAQIIETTTDKTGNGVPDIIISRYSGGNHCCTETYFLKLGGNFQIIEAPSTQAIGRNPKGGLIFESFDSQFQSWLNAGCMACVRPAVGRLVLEFRSGVLRPNFELMRRPPPSLADLRSKAQKYRHQLSPRPYKGTDAEPPGLIYSGIISADVEDENDKEPSVPIRKRPPMGVPDYESPFWDEMIDLIYTGNEDVAWQFLDLIWPPQKQGKQLFIRDFKKQLLESQYWKMILEDNRK